MLHPLILQAKEKAEFYFNFFVEVHKMTPQQAELHILMRLDMETARATVKS